MSIPLNEDELMNHFREAHTEVPDLNNRAPGVSLVDYLRMVHELDHSEGEGMILPHDHEEGRTWTPTQP